MAAPARISPARMASAPRMPQNSTRYCNAAGTAKWVNTSTKTKMLSTLRLFSMR